jgi:hypothetical protein
MAKIDPDTIPEEVSHPNSDSGFGKRLSNLAVDTSMVALEAYEAMPNNVKGAANMADHETVAITINRETPGTACITMFGNDSDGKVLYHLRWDMTLVATDRWSDADRV